MQLHVVVFEPDRQSRQSDRKDTVAVLSVLVTFKVVLSCRHKASGGGSKGTMPDLSGFFLFLFFFLIYLLTLWYQIDSLALRWVEVVFLQIRSGSEF